MPEQLSKTLLSWASIVDSKTLNQAHTLSRLPFIEGHVALMPDAHLGKGATVGSVIPTSGAIIPAAVGVDLGCGMIATQTDLTASDLPEDLSALLRRIEEEVPAGMGKETDSNAGGRYLSLYPLESPYAGTKEVNRAVRQFGTLGSGNHFIEICLDPNDGVWAVVHSGSRGIGNILAREHIKRAQGLMREYFITLDDPDLAYFIEGSKEFGAYIRDLDWAQRYAFHSRQQMMDRVIASMAVACGRPIEHSFTVNCHHNYASREHHWGKNILVTRKGAISAREGQYGVIPGSMGTDTYIVRGYGHPASFNSAPHGAGRVMSRTQAKRELTAESLSEMMKGKTWLSGKANKLVDEHPDAYKPIKQVIRDSADLVEVVTILQQILNYKGA